VTVRVFVSGQSNALGRGTGGPLWNRISSNVRVWNNANPLGSLGDSFVSAEQARQAGTFEHLNRGNFAVWFCDRLARASLDSVDMTLVAVGGSPISRWSPQESEFPILPHIVDVWEATGQAPADVFLWHQGESDVQAPDGWGAAFDAVVSNLTAAGVINDQAAIIVGGIVENSKERSAFNRQHLFRAATRHRGAFASSHGLTAYDGAHFTASGLKRLGTRYFNAYRFAKLRSI
jgi:hypothetical protein